MAEIAVTNCAKIEDYKQALLHAGGEVRVVEHGTPVTAALEGVGGLLLTGGEDVAPALYGEEKHAATVEVAPERDAFEIALAKEARRIGLPIFAICRGIQVLNVALGGTLVQDLATERPSATRHARDDAADQRVHGIVVQAGSRLADALGTTELDANSLHHQAIDRLATELRATAHAPDGVIEGVEVASDWWVLGAQWHPEELIDDPRPWDRGLFAAFAARCK